MLQQTKEKPQKRATPSKVKTSRRGGGRCRHRSCLSTALSAYQSANEEREQGREGGRKVGSQSRSGSLCTLSNTLPYILTDSPSLTEQSRAQQHPYHILPFPHTAPPPPCPIAGHRSHLEISKTCLYNKTYKQVFSLVFYIFFFLYFGAAAALLLLPSFFAFFACVCRQFRNLF